MFSQMTDDIENILYEHIISSGHIGEAYESLRAIISARPINERDSFMQLLNKHKKMDDFDFEEVGDEEIFRYVPG